MIRDLFLVLVAASVASASSSVRGLVSTEQGHADVPASVSLLNPVSQKVVYQTRVVQGTFRFESVKPGSYFLTVEFVGMTKYTDLVSVAHDQVVDMGTITLRPEPVAPDYMMGWSTTSLPKLEAVDAHVRNVMGVPMMTVCEYLKLRSATPLVYRYGAIVVGILVQTPQGSWLRQSCRDTLRFGDYSWPNAIALEESKSGSPSGMNWADYVPHLTRPSNEELDPWDREGNWAAFFGPLETRGNLVAAPSGSGRLCANGYGAVCAPARLLYNYSYYFRAK